MDFKVIVYEKLMGQPIVTYFYGAKSKQQVIDHYGLNEPDVESYQIIEI